MVGSTVEEQVTTREGQATTREGHYEDLAKDEIVADGKVPTTRL